MKTRLLPKPRCRRRDDHGASIAIWARTPEIGNRSGLHN